MKISVVIPSYNTQDSIENTLRHLVQQNINIKYEIIVVDCSEHNKVKQIVHHIKESFANLRYVHKQARFNPGEGRNIGAHEARGDLLVFIDADVLLAPNSLQTSWNHFQDGKQIFGGALELNTNVNNGLAAYIEHYFFNPEAQKHRPACERKNLSSALMCFDKELFLKEGGFRDIPRVQDTELTERLRRQGLRSYFFPDILAYQTQDSPLSGVLKKIYINGQNIYYIRYQASISPFKKFAFFVSLPLMTIFKIWRIIARHLLYQTFAGKLITLAISLPLFISSLFWMAGFYNALITEKGIGTER
jgi:glycosyltransferase involved in cell wall biosynthesis